MAIRANSAYLLARHFEQFMAIAGQVTQPELELGLQLELELQLKLQLAL